MAYLGARPTTNFRVAPTKDTFTGDGSTTTFDLANKVPAGAGSSALESIVIGITISNTSSSGITASVFLDNNAGSNDVHIVKDATIPAGSSLEVMSGNKIVLQNTGSAADVLRVSASASNSADALVSVLEDV